jgi:transposase
MVWAAMKSSGAICLRRCPPKMNAASYQGVLASAKSFIKPRCVFNIPPAVFNLFPLHRGGRWKNQQDGASPHRALTTKAWLRRNNIRLLNRGFWPPISPDMNPIELLWPMGLKKLNGAIFSGREQLWASLQDAFASISADQVDRLYKSMRNRMAAVRAARGGATRY